MRATDLDRTNLEISTEGDNAEKEVLPVISGQLLLSSVVL
jgi:hypothetical protein